MGGNQAVTVTPVSPGKTNIVAAVGITQYINFISKCTVRGATQNVSVGITATNPLAKIAIHFTGSKSSGDNLSFLTGPSFCTSCSERVYITAMGCEIEFGGTRGLRAAGAGGL